MIGLIEGIYGKKTNIGNKLEGSWFIYQLRVVI